VKCKELFFRISGAGEVQVAGFQFQFQ